ncbi:Crp/Fnr family transcriptional regulator [Flavobacterium sp.]|uniref:Crp/Fnr family transcriptional regulator n=1 Tax=Flavobacterium sp. TaxID=239 RepID=UPI0035B05F5F
MTPLNESQEQNSANKKTYSPIIQQIATFLFSKKVKKKEFLLQAGEVSDCIFFVKKGLLRVYLDYEGKEVNTWFVKENDFISSVNSYYYSIPSVEYIKAFEDCEILFIKKNTYDTLLKYNHKLAIFEINELYIKLCEYSDQCQLLRFMNAEKKYEFLATKKPDILNRLSQKHIASFLGIETTYLSKIRSNYKE